jgi:uncharacterized integral membrane protein
MLRIIKLVVLLLALVIGLLFTYRNGQFVQLDYYLGTLDLALSWLLLGALALGVVIGVLVSLTFVLPAKREARHARKAQASAEKEVTELRALSSTNEIV